MSSVSQEMFPGHEALILIGIYRNQVLKVLDSLKMQKGTTIQFISQYFGA